MILNHDQVEESLINRDQENEAQIDINFLNGNLDLSSADYFDQVIKLMEFYFY